MKHQFLLKEGKWLGEGMIKLSLSDEPLKFYMRWTITPEETSGGFECSQEIQISGISDAMYNEFYISDITNEHFSFIFENNEMGTIEGKGYINESVVGWELKDPEKDFEGFEFYKLEEDGKYFMHAEYATGNTLRTEIQGRIWHSPEEE